MKLFILAAGKGERLMPLTKDIPKSLIDLGDGSTMISRQIQKAERSGIFDEIIVITGYRAAQIRNAIDEKQRDIRISFVHNPYYCISNNLMSMWTAHFLMRGNDFMITNGDNVYLTDVYNSVYTDTREIIQLTIDFKWKYDTDDMKVCLDSKNRVVRVSKDLPPVETHAESVGLALVRGERSREIFVNTLLELASDPGHMNSFWLEIFNELHSRGISLESAVIESDDWIEIDFHPDIEAIRKIVLGK